MPTYCAVPGCKNRGGFSFPSEPALQKAWCVAIRRATEKGDLWKPNNGAVICERHFEPQDIVQVQPPVDVGQRKKRKLQKGAVPKVFDFVKRSDESARAKRAKRRTDETPPSTAPSTSGTAPPSAAPLSPSLPLPSAASAAATASSSSTAFPPASSAGGPTTAPSSPSVSGTPSGPRKVQVHTSVHFHKVIIFIEFNLLLTRNLLFRFRGDARRGRKILLWRCSCRMTTRKSRCDFPLFFLS